MKINLGASRNWFKSGWAVLDHKIEKSKDLEISGDISNMDLKDKSCDLVFLSHVLEHIPNVKLQNVFIEINRVMKKDAGIRILIPDLKKLSEAYVNQDYDFFEEVKIENEAIRTDLGLGGMLMNFIVAVGQDTVLLNRNCDEFISGYSHLYLYDFDMMKILLENYGFKNVRQVQFCESSYPEFEEPLHVSHLEPVWRNLNQEFYQKNNLVHEYINGSYNINFKVTGFDRNPIISLIIEAEKEKDFMLTEENDLNRKGANNYNFYGNSLLEDTKIREKINYITTISKKIENPKFKEKLDELLKIKNY